MVAGGSGVFSVSRSACVYHSYPVVFGQGAWRGACHDVLNVWNMLVTVESPFKGILCICQLSSPLFWYFSENFLCVYVGRVSYPKIRIAKGQITPFPEIVNSLFCACLCIYIHHQLMGSGSFISALPEAQQNTWLALTGWCNGVACSCNFLTCEAIQTFLSNVLNVEIIRCGYTAL